jgi:BirA family biotin operon repressor/biotin-[acetyl-CoA-carboxylase] ligase
VVNDLASALPNLPAGYQLRHLAEVDSTNEEARRLAAQGETVPTWIMADRQTAGRGRRGRAWASPSGNLMTTLYLPQGFDAVSAGQIAFVAGLALEDTVRGFMGAGAQVSLKWPNDVLINGKKASGILLESAMRDNKLDWLAVGLGLNLAHHPDDTPYPATNMQNEGCAPISNGQALAHLAAAFDAVFQQWQRGGFAPILTAWRQVAHGLGGPIVARLENHQIEGMFQDIDEKGALMLRDGAGETHIIDAGDVFFPEAE